MDLADFVGGNRHLLPALRWLGQQNWMHFEPHGDDTADDPGKGFVECKLKKLIPPPEISMDVNFIVKFAASNHLFGFWANSLSHILSEGPKMIRTSYQQCVALHNTSIGIQPELYHAPFPTLIIEINSEWVKERMREEKMLCYPEYVVLHDSGTYLVMSAWFRKALMNTLTPSDMKCVEQEAKLLGVSVETILKQSEGEAYEIHRWFPKRLHVTLEEAFTLIGERADRMNDPAFKLAWDDYAANEAYRIATNVALWATHSGISETGWISGNNHKHNLKAVKYSGSKTKELKRKERAKEFLLADIKTYAFAQNITLYDSELEEGETGRTIEGRRSPRVHWRRGHWRKQPIGPRTNPEIRLVPIKPILVNASRFVGAKADTSVTYEVKE